MLLQYFSDNYPFKILIMIARMKKIAATINVRIEITFSAPLSLVLTNTLRPPPVIAPEAPSDFPPWSKQRTIMMMLVDNKTQSYHSNILVFSFVRTGIILQEIFFLIN